MESSERQLALIERFRTAEHVTVAELAELTGSSEMTIRRDLDQLAARGVVRRVRGGAVSLLLRGEAPPYAVRAHENAEVKARLAAEVAGLLADGEAVVLDSGTTTLAVARALAGRRLTVVPLDLHAAMALADAPEVRLLLPGGLATPGSLYLTGPLTENALRSLRVDTAVIGVCGLDAEYGLTAHDLHEVPAKRAAIAAARRTIAVCEGGKLARAGLGVVCPATDLDAVVTDASAPPEIVAALQSAGVAVRIV
ncbi:DeoR/GlpR family DNA-binding transcription regulator [Actinomadura parmotrematis]|uniref:DeoR/GlpR family DNA-binding transcription regulator n=1 Tax=Actinomadura parmotrematis TaxID=2864039 RepID=A0ABS7G280_9ACTN|nr:DeoR/GlpR family DNA-binding transcription regulator [Actinomadura parmotrematis]MBW8485753.1 DeoR/GlpR family DNA-binding transcription regulator [Actinomadura parmotrematis]